MSLPPIFHTYDIRGVYERELTDDLAEKIGKAVGTFYQRNNIKTVIVGRDNRPSGNNLHKRFIAGLVSTGCDVVNVGIVTTPMVYFTWFHLDANAAVVITASHNPAEYNGIKMTMNKQGLLGTQYQEIKKIVEAGDFMVGAGSVLERNITNDYIEAVIKDIKITKRLKVVIDTGNGTCSLFVPGILKRFDVETIELFTESDGTFPNHPAYPQKTEYYTKLSETIKSEKADFGLAFDGDGDRVSVYDENGQFVQNDILGALFGRTILEKNPGQSIVMNISASQAVIDDVQNHSGNFVLWKTGYPFIVSKMKEIDAIFGGEISGHFFFKDRYFGYDDGIYSALRFIELMSASNQKVSEIIATLPKYESSSEFRAQVPEDANKFQIVEDIKKEIIEERQDAQILDFDGIRFTLPNNSWGLIRPSNTESMLSGRAEGKTKEDLDKMKEYIKRKLAKHQIVLNW